MLPSSKVAAIERLLAEGRWSYREIARQMGVGHSVVGRIALGQHYHQRASAEDGSNSRLTRCPDCGALVQLPCRLCALRARQAVNA